MRHTIGTIEKMSVFSNIRGQNVYENCVYVKINICLNDSEKCYDTMLDL